MTNDVHNFPWEQAQGINERNVERRNNGMASSVLGVRERHQLSRLELKSDRDD